MDNNIKNLQLFLKYPQMQISNQAELIFVHIRINKMNG